MLIVRIQLVGDAGAPAPHDDLQPLADTRGVVLGSQPVGTWVTLDYLPRERYAANATRMTPDVRPVLVFVTLTALPEENDLSRLVAALTSTIADQLDRPKHNTHVWFEPPAAGRIAFGGNFVRS
ncbi:MAG: tautomerase family protein [Pseudomonadales bacterium]|jgi:phenylpyruvate tautomerase PptA (4-oxalocrotonate tautomerase family)|nr:tautomerase family protein [Pseudomonadales bacterium]MDP6472723.1 tautomerase family protein [Pseudomonadales bacterium]MDP6827935.1 tautomerase family protein [Pseudomonadales bacterium]MDP6973482.1 tautomerase family protein [Pseudomonadales bacterium]|tara:strand:- start:1238 stop:1609 length:372 start_codon:yes stop_codon:yes gene_type:complete